MPIKVTEIELSTELEPIPEMEGYQRLLGLVRYHGRPLGWIDIEMNQPSVSVERLSMAISEQIGWQVVQAVLGQKLGMGTEGTDGSVPISVVVCTRGQTTHLERCIQSLLTLDYPHYEILVVDNTPGDGDIAQKISHPAVRYIRETRPGLNWGRNRGIAEARYDIIAFTNDNTRVDRRWLRSIANAFKSPAMAVTGLVAPAELETESQICFEHQYGMGRELRWQALRRDRLTSSVLLWANSFGAGANMAFRRELFAEIGPFDEALGSGTPVGGGGDLEFLHRLVNRGHTLVYEPSALVWHHHPRDATSLRQLIHSRGRSLGAYLVSSVQNGTVRRRSVLYFIARKWPAWWTLRRLYRPGKCPRYIILGELAGALASPWAYWAAQRRAQQIGRTSAPGVVPGNVQGSEKIV